MHKFTFERILYHEYSTLSIGDKIIGDQAAFMLSAVVIDKKVDHVNGTKIHVQFTDKRPPFRDSLRTRIYEDYSLYNNIFRVSDNVLNGDIPLAVLKEHINNMKIPDQDHELDILEGIEAVIKNYNPNS